MLESQELEDIHLAAPDGSSVPLASVWERRSVVLVLVRHFG